MLEVVRIWMNYEENPVGVAEMPQFGWEINSDKKNVIQKSYRLQIGTDSSFYQLIYDSGEINSSASAHIFIDSVPLKICCQVFCKGLCLRWTGTKRLVYGNLCYRSSR